MATSLPSRRDSTMGTLLEQMMGRPGVSTSLEAPISSRHDKFYLTDEMAVFQVEDRLFRVPQCLFSLNSPIFKSMFSLPHGDHGGEVIEGKSDEKPIYLFRATVLEFEMLLRCLLEGMFHDFDLPESSWITLLSIAHHYEFLNIYKRAIYELYDRPASGRQSSDSASDPSYAELISVAEKYDVPFKHALSSIVALVVRSGPLTEVEVVHLSTQAICRLVRAREEYIRMTLRRAMTCSRESVAENIVRTIWGVTQN